MKNEPTEQELDEMIADPNGIEADRKAEVALVLTDLTEFCVKQADVLNLTPQQMSEIYGAIKVITDLLWNSPKLSPCTPQPRYYPDQS